MRRGAAPQRRAAPRRHPARACVLRFAHPGAQTILCLPIPSHPQPTASTGAGVMAPPAARRHRGAQLLLLLLLAAAASGSAGAAAAGGDDGGGAPKTRACLVSVVKNEAGQIGRMIK